MILPGSCLGVFGGGQLGWMFVVAARAMGYRTVVFDPDSRSPAGAAANQHICADFMDMEALDQFAQLCDAVTVEFENVPVAALNYVHERVTVAPVSAILSVTQDRVKEKKFVNDIGIETVAFKAINSAADITSACDRLKPPFILKTSRLGYDGKGQREVANQQEACRAFDEFGQCACVLEQKVALQKEISVIVARGEDGSSVCYPVAENEHIHGILHLSIVPACCAPQDIEAARHKAVAIADALEYQGVMGVEFFITQDGKILVNEIAPRPHNSGHYTIDACVTGQFQQQVRALCGLPLGATTLLSPVVMVNLLGDLWQSPQAEPPDFSVLCDPDIKLHLYGKHEARPGRKMGHFCLLGKDADLITTRARQIHASLLSK